MGTIANCCKGIGDVRRQVSISNFSMYFFDFELITIIGFRKIESYRPTKSPGPQRIVSLHAYVLRTRYSWYIFDVFLICGKKIFCRCVYISVLLTMHASWGVSEKPLLNFTDNESNYSLSDEHRTYIRKFIARDKALVLLKLWDICSNTDGLHTVWDFMDVIVSDAAPTFNLAATGGNKSTSQWTLDRKKDRVVTAEMKQVLLLRLLFLHLLYILNFSLIFSETHQGCFVVNLSFHRRS